MFRRDKMEKFTKECIITGSIVVGAMIGWFGYGKNDRIVGALTGITVGVIISEVVITLF